MKTMTKKAENHLKSVIRNIEKGDYMKFDGLTLYVYNSQGCLIDYINCYEN